VDLAEIAARTPGFAGADLANIVNEAALLAARKGRDTVEDQDFSEAIDRVVAGLEKKSRILSGLEKERVAYHESGHAIVGEVLAPSERVTKISIIPRGVAALGYTMQLPTEDRYLLTESELHGKLAALLGGRAAEEVVFGELSTGAANDLSRATEIARAMVVDYGMSRKIGPVSMAKERRPSFLPGDYGGGREVGDRTADEIDDEIKSLVERAAERARETLTKNRAVLEALAKGLIESEHLEGAELRKILDGVRVAGIKDPYRELEETAAK
jgi:cell division protease FtsH